MPHRYRPLFITCLTVLVIAGISLFPTGSSASTAKEKYLSADSCFQKLRRIPVKKQTERGWLKCISQYEIIYRLHPENSWAPAGMFKASQLYIQLSKISGKKKYKVQAADLLVRIKNRYYKSAYAKRAGTLLKSLDVSPVAQKGRINHKKSKKRLTRNDVLIRKYTRNGYKASLFTDDHHDKPLPPKEKLAGDATISDLRFWSNPEYTRIVVNADRERDYSHRLLKRDPKINQMFQRLYVDIEQSKLGKSIQDHTDINDNLLKQARAGQFAPHTVRVVVDIKSFKNYKIFSLKDPFRIVIDVWGKDSNGAVAAVSKQPSAKPKSPKPASKQKLNQISTDHLKSSDIARQLALGVRTIVIDPGHGGSDPGAPGYFKNVWEKDIVLKIAKKLARTLRDRLKCNVLLTRSSDKKLTLEERTAIANTKKADLFISLHCNAAKNRRLKGIETYLLNLATDDRAIAVAAKENATSEKNISDLDYILKDLMNNAKINESTRLAQAVHTSYVKGMKRQFSEINDLGVKQAPFYVLLGARMPSILIETAFISNKKECKRLMTDSYQAKISENITNGIEKYIQATNPRQL